MARTTAKALLPTVLDQIVKIVNLPEIQARLRSLGLTPTGTPAGAVNSGLAADYAYWGKLIAELGITVE